MKSNSRSPFHAMCVMWGIEIALKKCEEFGIRVSQEEIDEEEKISSRIYEAMIDIALFGKTIRQFPRENIRFLGGIVYMKKSTGCKWICVCAMSMEELAIEMERQTPKMLRNGRSRPGWAEDMAGKFLLRYADSLRRKLGFPRKDIHLIEWSPERLEMLMEMYPGVPWCDLSDKKKLDAERNA